MSYYYWLFYINQREYKWFFIILDNLLQKQNVNTQIECLDQIEKLCNIYKP